MFGLGAQELIIILVIVLILFGAKKIPQLGSGLGQGIVNFKKGIRDTGAEETTLETTASDRETPV